jgi:hypothetical protein
MKPGALFFPLISLILLFSTINQSKAQKIKAEERAYIFFLHNNFIEENELTAVHPMYGRAEYNEILDAFKNAGFVVISEKRKAKTDMKMYAKKIAGEIDSLLKMGIKPNRITVIGTSKGGYIAQYVSTFLKNPDVNFVFIGCFQESDIVDRSEINFCGNILTIYEKSDANGVSAIRRKETSKLKINHFKEIELNTNLKHGFLFKALPEWIEPCIMWANGNYQLKKEE